METITIVNKGGKVVKTSKHLLGIFQEAKSAYQEKKAHLKAEIHAQKAEKAARKQLEQLQLQPQIEDSRSVAPPRKHRHPGQERGFVDDISVASSHTHHSHRTRRERGHRSRHHDDDDTSTIRERRPKTALTADALESLSQASSSVAPSSYTGSQRPATSRRSHTARNPPTYYTQSAVSRPNTTISRRHTDFPPDYESQYDQPQRPRVSVKPRSIFDPEDHEPSQTRQPMPQQPLNLIVRGDIEQRLALQRANTTPTHQNDGLAYGNPGGGEARDYYDPHLAYGTLPPGHAPPVPPLPTSTDLAPPNQERELQDLTTKLDDLLLEAKCVQHTATTIMSTLQKNPDAMAAVALTLAELSSIITKIAPGALPAVMTALKTGSPAIFALLCSPQFLIAGGVAVGVTVVMFGGYKIIKKIQANVAEKNEQKRVAAEAATPEEVIPFDPENYDDSVIESWRRGIAGVEESAVEDEFITPKADRLRRERSKHRRREERERLMEPSLSAQSSRSDLGGITVRRKPLPLYIDEDVRSERSSRSRRTSKTERSDKSNRSERSDATIKLDKKDKKEKKDKEKGEKKPSALRMMFKGSSSVNTKGKEVALRA